MAKEEMAPASSQPLVVVVVVVVALQLLATVASAAPNAHIEYVNLHELSSGTSRGPSRSSTLASKWTLQLLHRDAVTGRNHSSHRHRLDELLKRDGIRVASLIQRLTARYEVEDFGSEVVSGLPEGSGEFFVLVGVGSPPVAQYMVVDSGSDVVWVQCEPCSECYAQSYPVFDPASSASFSGVSCGSPICSLLDHSAGCLAGRCRYEVSYGDGSYTRGTLALETLTFGGTIVQNVVIGCGHRNRGLFVGAAGLLGLGGGPMSFVGQLGGHAGGAFSYCLVSRGSNAVGSLVFGRRAAVPVGAAWVPLVRNPHAPSFYYVGLAGLGVGGARVAVDEEVFQLSDEGEGGVVMDTGTAVTRLPEQAYAALRDAFAGMTVGLPRAPAVSIFDTCYALQGFESVRVPTVSFYFAGGTVMTLPARNFLIPVDEMGRYCFAFAPSPNGLSIMGNIQQEGIQITFDEANGFVGFGPNSC